MADIIRRCGSDPEKLFKFSDLQAQLKEFGIYGAVVAPTLLQIMVSDPKNIVDIEGYIKDVMDGDTKANIVNFDELSEKVFKQRLCEALDDAALYGWI